MSGRARLPSGEPRKASQRRTRRATSVPTVIEPSWRPGDKIHWRGYTGAFLRDAVDGQTEVLIGTRTYLVRKIELQSTQRAIPARPQGGAIMVGDITGRITMREMTYSRCEREGRYRLSMTLLVVIAAAGPATAATRVPVDPNPPPWNAVTKVQTNIGTRCTGVLIAPSVVLTATHCLYNPRTRALLQPVSLHVLFGFERDNYRQHLLVARYQLGPGFMPGLRQPQPGD
jgi:hypothetical protein